MADGVLKYMTGKIPLELKHLLYCCRHWRK